VILRAADRVAVPWKNGGGLTREVAAHPPHSDLGNFDWRVSLAEVSRGGPFSSFPGVDRHMAVISGRIELSISDRPALGLSADSAPLSFPGEAPVYAEPHAGPDAGPVTDLNVMTRRGRCEARLTRCSVAAYREISLEADATLLLALTQLTLRAASLDANLSALDAARLSTNTEILTVHAAAAGAAFWLIEIRTA
jgi:environmental stress-induced protein Ves